MNSFAAQGAAIVALGDGEPDRRNEVVAVDCFPAHLPMTKVLTMSSHRITYGPVLFVRIRARCGAEGWGEAGADPTMSGDTLAGMVAAIEHHLKPRLIGRSVFERVALSRRLRHELYANGGPKAAVDMALLDLAGHIVGARAVDLLGGAARDRATVLRLVGGSGVAAKDVEEAAPLAEQGFTAFKLKVGLGRIEQEAETVRALRETLGPDVMIAADANMAWNTARARQFAELAAPYDLAFLEQPVAAGDVSRMAKVAAGSTVPLGADEAIHGIGDILSLARENAIGGVSLKTIKLGSMTALHEAAIVCDAIGLSVNLAMLVESSLASAAMVHAACAVPQIDWGLSLGGLLVSEDPVTEPLRCHDGQIECPRGPGLGVRVDEALLAKLAPNS
jgi:L-alanine-DL-glutamate epimerase-like enolase superfamily enzyme